MPQYQTGTHSLRKETNDFFQAFLWYVLWKPDGAYLMNNYEGNIIANSMDNWTNTPSRHDRQKLDEAEELLSVIKNRN